MFDSDTQIDLIVVGGGSGGIGAALSAARLGLRVLLVEKRPMLGGTSTLAGVCCWEPSVGGTGIPFDIYRRLKRIPDAVGIYTRGRHFGNDKPNCWPHDFSRVSFPGAESLIDPGCDYVDSLQRHVPRGETLDEAFRHRHWHGVMFDPEAMAGAAMEMLAETGCCEVRLNTAFVDADSEDGVVRKAFLSDGTEVEAAFWVDATGDGILSRTCGAGSLIGTDSQSRFNEPSAPVEGDEHAVNGATLLFRISPTVTLEQEVPEPPSCWWAEHYPPVVSNQLPNGDLQINMLPTMPGSEWVEHDPDSAYRECEKRVQAQWAFLQYGWPEFRKYRFVSAFPELGVRESRRIVCEYMLREQDVVSGLGSQTHPDIIAVTDHPCDVHGKHGRGIGELSEPYGIPYRSLVVKEFRNLLVACRSAGFSAIAASSCRLSRTMIQLGQAAGTATAIAKEMGVSLPDVPAEELRESLRAQHVQLEWPMDEPTRQYLDMP